MTRKRWMIAILVIWALSLGWLVKREVFRPTGARLAEAALAIPPGALFYRLEVGDQQVGYSSTTIDTVAGGSVIRVENVFVLTSLRSASSTARPRGARPCCRARSAWRASSRRSTAMSASLRRVAKWSGIRFYW
jgi:hypothetical protein